MHGDSDIAVIGALLADRGRCRMLLALDDGRALPATRLAAEAGVSRATASAHLGKLLDAGLLTVESTGRHRYYRLADDRVGQLLELIAQLAPTERVTSLRQSAKGKALRMARTCYDHLAGRLGVELMARMIEQQYVSGGDGRHDPRRAERDTPVGFGHDLDYRLTNCGREFLHGLGVALPENTAAKYCVDWTEQRHHLAGAVGRALLIRLLELDWIRRSPNSRAVHVTDAGRTGLAATFKVDHAILVGDTPMNVTKIA